MSSETASRTKNSTRNMFWGLLYGASTIVLPFISRVIFQTIFVNGTLQYCRQDTRNDFFILAVFIRTHKIFYLFVCIFLCL